MTWPLQTRRDHGDHRIFYEDEAVPTRSVRAGPSALICWWAAPPCAARVRGLGLLEGVPPRTRLGACTRKPVVCAWVGCMRNVRGGRVAWLFGSDYSNGYSRAASSRNSTSLPPARSVAPVPSTSGDRTRTLAHQRTNICFNRQSIRAPARCSVGRSMRTAFQRLGVENQIRRKLAAVLQMLVVERP